MDSDLEKFTSGHKPGQSKKGWMGDPSFRTPGIRPDQGLVGVPGRARLASSEKGTSTLGIPEA